MKITNLVPNPLSIIDGAKNAVEDTARQVVNGAGDVFDTAKDLASTVGMIDVKPNTVVGSAEHLLGIGGDSRSKLIDDTRDLRNQAANIRALQAELGGMKPSDPDYAKTAQALKDASAALQGKYGYTASSLPAPGSLWVDPEFLSKDLPNDQVTASKFPVGKPVMSPPDAETALFGSGQPYRMTDPSGAALRPETASMKAYETQVAHYREQQGMPREGGKPIGVQVNFEGGGGKGKRYASALQEMARLGVVPTSVAGTSAGSIAAMLVAGGADPVEMQRFVTDPALGKLLDVQIPGGGAAAGQNAYDLMDQELRKLTGITDRPVTFADLKMPLQIVATKMSDSDPAPGTTDLTQKQNRIFVFSQQTTPNTPVALAVRASMAIPGVFDPVQMVDPMTGREVKLVDGGVLDNLPMNESPDFKLPVVGLSLAERDDESPDASRPAAKPLPGGNINVGNIFDNAKYGLEMNKDGATGTDDYHDRTEPKPGQFMLTLPTWNLEDPSKKDSTMKFGYDNSTDPAIDAQTRDVTVNFFKGVIDQIGNPAAKGSNVPSSIPANFQFSVPVHAKGNDYVASYSGGDSVTFTGKDGKSFSAKLGRDKIEAMYADGLSFGMKDLGSQLGYAVDHPVGDWLGNALPF